MIINRIQKTIISKYLDLVDKELVTETEITLFILAIENLYKNKVLSDSDIFRQKIQFILDNLKSDFEIVKRKRTHKEVKLTINKDFYKLLKEDLEGINYSQTELTDLDKFENEKELSISFENTNSVLKNIVISKRKLAVEADLEKFVTEQLVKVFGKEKVHRQYSVGGFLALKTDIDIGNGQVGIELKIADNLNASDMQRLIGQVVYYRSRFYSNNLVVFLVSKSTITPTLKELKDFIEELGVPVIFSTAITL